MKIHSSFSLVYKSHLFIILQKLFPKNFKMIMRADFATITSPTPQAFQADFCFHLSRTPFLFFPFSNSVLLCPYFSHASRSGFKCHYHIILQEASQGTVRTCGQQKAHLCLKGVKRSRLRETRAASRESSQRDLQNCGDGMIFYEWGNLTPPFTASAPCEALRHSYPRSILDGFRHLIGCNAIASRQVGNCAR